MDQYYYYERMRLLILCNTRGCVKVQHVNPTIQQSVRRCLV